MVAGGTLVPLSPGELAALDPRARVVAIAVGELDSDDWQHYQTEAAPVYPFGVRKSWCGIFALYVCKLSGLKMSPWPLKYLKGDGIDELSVSAKPRTGDIGIVDARNTNRLTNHHFIVTDVQGGVVKSIDGNAGMLMEIVQNQHSISKVNSTGGFLSPVWSKVL